MNNNKQDDWDTFSYFLHKPESSEWHKEFMDKIRNGGNRINEKGETMALLTEKFEKVNVFDKTENPVILDLINEIENIGNSKYGMLIIFTPHKSHMYIEINSMNIANGALQINDRYYSSSINIEDINAFSLEKLKK